MIDPAIPTKWDGYRVVREFRGEVFDITIKNPNHVSRGVASLTVDGKEITGNIIPVANGGKRHIVEVVLG